MIHFELIRSIIICFKDEYHPISLHKLDQASCSPSKCINWIIFPSFECIKLWLCQLIRLARRQSTDSFYWTKIMGPITQYKSNYELDGTPWVTFAHDVFASLCTWTLPLYSSLCVYVVVLLLPSSTKRKKHEIRNVKIKKWIQLLLHVVGISVFAMKSTIIWQF